VAGSVEEWLALQTMLRSLRRAFTTTLENNKKEIRRHRGRNHSSIWKIAYADFMTAMISW
jgi:hypothetical protein